MGNGKDVPGIGSSQRKQGPAVEAVEQVGGAGRGQTHGTVGETKGPLRMRSSQGHQGQQGAVAEVGE